MRVAGLLPHSSARLEIGPSLRPRLPIPGTRFIDLSVIAVERLHSLGGEAGSGEITQLSFADGQFDLVAVFDVIEHVEDDRKVFAELTCVLKPGRGLCAVPLHAVHWAAFDTCVGHARRYDPAELGRLLVANGLEIEQSAILGIQPINTRIL